MIAMWVIWLLALYGLSTILIQLCKRWNPYFRKVQQINIDLLVYNSEENLEDAIRTLNRLSYLEGKAIHISVYDFGSTDDTSRLLQLFQKKYPFLITQIVEQSNEFLSYDQYPFVKTMIDLRKSKGIA